MAGRKWVDLKLDVGCGTHKHGGFTGMDIRKLEGVDVVHDANILPWPFPDNCARTIVMTYVMEYLEQKQIFSIFDDIWRICKPGANMLITNHYTNSYMATRDPMCTHTGYNEDWPYFLDPTQTTSTDEYLYEMYQPKPWEILQIDYKLGAVVNTVLRPFKRDGKKFSISKKKVLPQRI